MLQIKVKKLTASGYPVFRLQSVLFAASCIVLVVMMAQSLTARIKKIQADRRVTCSELTYAEAQGALKAGATYLDRDKDGKACDHKETR